MAKGIPKACIPYLILRAFGLLGELALAIGVPIVKCKELRSIVLYLFVYFIVLSDHRHAFSLVGGLLFGLLIFALELYMFLVVLVFYVQERRKQPSQREESVSQEEIKEA